MGNENSGDGRIWDMRRLGLNFLTIFSLVMMGLLALGYFSEFGPIFSYNFRSGSKPHVHLLTVSAQAGRIAVFYAGGQTSGTGPASGRLSAWWQGFRFREPELRRSLW